MLYLHVVCVDRLPNERWIDTARKKTSVTPFNVRLFRAVSAILLVLGGYPIRRIWIRIP